MAKIAQVIDRFESRGKLILTMWDLDRLARFTIRVKIDAEVEIGEVLRLADEYPKLRRISRGAVDENVRKSAILPIVFHGVSDVYDGVKKRYA